MGPILVFGHRNPDNDSICSAVAYAHLKNLTDPGNVYIAGRLGEAPRETEWVFTRFGLELPLEIAHVHACVSDVMTAEPAVASVSDSMLAVGRIMRERDVRGLPIVADDGTLAGLVSERILAERYVSETEPVAFAQRPVTVGQLLAALDGTLLAGDPDATVAGDVRIGAYEPETMRKFVQPGDIVIVGDRVRTQPVALEQRAMCLIVAGGVAPADGVVLLAREMGAAVILTDSSVHAALRLVGLAHAVSDFMDRDPLQLTPDTLLSEAAEELLGSAQRSAVIVDDERRPVGILSRTDLARREGRRVVLVDHNEASQSAAGIEEASVVEIVDHHRVGDIQTHAPILFLNMPVGATATIVAERYRELGVEIPDAIAGALLSAVLTDTVLLKSPTTTGTDSLVAERLSAQLGLDALEFGMELFRARTADQPFIAERVVRSDLKEYRSGDLRIGIAQFETVDLGEVLKHRAEVVASLQDVRAREGYDLIVLLLTDIVREGSEILADGKVRLAERALGIVLEGGEPAWMPGVLSRKKQVAPKLVAAAGS